MSGIGSKLSRHVLGMKFMRKTKDQFDKSEKASSTSASVSTSSVKSESSNKVKNETTDTPASLVVEELWSYNQCERYIFGRQSFGGFNPSVEKNVRKGIWKPFYLDDDENPIYSSDDEKKRQSDVDVSDEEMAKTYGSLIGTLAKRFRGKDKGKKKNFKDNAKGKGKDKKPKWSKKFPENFNDNKNKADMKRGNYNNNKRQRESTGSNFEEDRRQRNSPQATSSKRHHGGYEGESNVPPQKRRKFLKPSE